MPPSGPTTGRPLSSSGGVDESSPAPELVLPPLLVLPLLLAPPLLLLPVPPPLPLPPELLPVPVEPPSPTLALEPPHPNAMTIDTPRTVRKADMKDLLVRDSPLFQTP
jgi:hypothetical protein